MDTQVKPVRRISNLIWVRRLDDIEAPWPKTRYTGARLEGKRYERRVKKLLEPMVPVQSQLLCGTWFSYEDEIGRGLAQPDYIIKTPRLLYLIEVKLSHTAQAAQQLKLLYRPLVESYFKLPTVLIEVCKNLRPDNSLNLITSLEGLRPGSTIHTLQWR